MARSGRNAAVTKYCEVQLTSNAIKWLIILRFLMMVGRELSCTFLPVVFITFSQYGLAKNLRPVFRFRGGPSYPDTRVVDETVERAVRKLTTVEVAMVLHVNKTLLLRDLGDDAPNAILRRNVHDNRNDATPKRAQPLW